MLSKCIILSCMMWLHFPSSVSAVSPLDIVLSFLFSRWFGSMHSLFHTQSSNRILRYSNLYRIPRMCLWCCLRPCLLLYFSSNSRSLSLVRSFTRLRTAKYSTNIFSEQENLVLKFDMRNFILFLSLDDVTWIYTFWNWNDTRNSCAFGVYGERIFSFSFSFFWKKQHTQKRRKMRNFSVSSGMKRLKNLYDGKEIS